MRSHFITSAAALTAVVACAGLAGPAQATTNVSGYVSQGQLTPQTVISHTYHLAGASPESNKVMDFQQSADIASAIGRSYSFNNGTLGVGLSAATVTVDLGYAHAGESFLLDYTMTATGGGINVYDQPGQPPSTGVDVCLPLIGVPSICERYTNYWAYAGDPLALDFNLSSDAAGQQVASSSQRLFAGSDYGVATGGAVPEPSGWGLMIAGFAAAGMMLRRSLRDI